MTDHIATIREALIGLGDDLRAVTGMPTEAPGLASLSAVEAELQRLRDDPNRMDLASVPEPWKFGELTRMPDDLTFEVCLYRTDVPDPTDHDHPEWRILAWHPTPRAALASAIERIGK